MGGHADNMGMNTTRLYLMLAVLYALGILDIMVNVHALERVLL